MIKSEVEIKSKSKIKYKFYKFIHNSFMWMGAFLHKRGILISTLNYQVTEDGQIVLASILVACCPYHGAIHCIKTIETTDKETIHRALIESGYIKNSEEEYYESIRTNSVH